MWDYRRPCNGRCADILGIARKASTENASSAFDLIPGARKVHVDGSSMPIGPLVRVFATQLARDRIDTIVARRSHDAGAFGTGAGRVNWSVSRSRQYARPCDLDRFGTTERH